MTTGGIAGMVRTTWAASAGSRRGSIAQTTTSAGCSAASVRTAATRPWRTTRSSTGEPVSTVTLRVAIRFSSASVSRAIPPSAAGTRQAPKDCSR